MILKKVIALAAVLLLAVQFALLWRHKRGRIYVNIFAGFDRDKSPILFQTVRFIFMTICVVLIAVVIDFAFIAP